MGTGSPRRRGAPSGCPVALGTSCPRRGAGTLQRERPTNLENLHRRLLPARALRLSGPLRRGPGSEGRRRPQPRARTSQSPAPPRAAGAAYRGLSIEELSVAPELGWSQRAGNPELRGQWLRVGFPLHRAAKGNQRESCVAAGILVELSTLSTARILAGRRYSNGTLTRSIWLMDYCNNEAPRNWNFLQVSPAERVKGCNRLPITGSFLSVHCDRETGSLDNQMAEWLRIPHLDQDCLLMDTSCHT